MSGPQSWAGQPLSSDPKPPPVVMQISAAGGGEQLFRVLLLHPKLQQTAAPWRVWGTSGHPRFERGDSGLRCVFLPLFLARFPPQGSRGRQSQRELSASTNICGNQGAASVLQFLLISCEFRRDCLAARRIKLGQLFLRRPLLTVWLWWRNGRCIR